MIKNTEIYLKENVDINVLINPWYQKDVFPILLKDLYNFYEMKVLHHTCIVFEPRDKLPLVKDLKKHLKRVEEIEGKPAVLNLKTITRHTRKTYIENRIPFIVENGQMYLPFLGLDLKDAPEKLPIKEEKFTPAAQIAYLALMYDKGRIITAGEFAEEFGYTLMTGSRVLNELYDKKLISYKIGGKTGRTKEYQRIPNPEYFQKGEQFLRNPVKDIVYVRYAPDDTLVAGLEALAEKSMLNPPDHFIRAMDMARFKELNIETIEEENITGFENLTELQLWEYDPGLFKVKNRVDMVSLYATLQEEKDERVEQALGAALGGEVWYMD